MCDQEYHSFIILCPVCKREISLEISKDQNIVYTNCGNCNYTLDTTLSEVK